MHGVELPLVRSEMLFPGMRMFDCAAIKQT